MIDLTTFGSAGHEITVIVAVGLYSGCSQKACASSGVCEKGLVSAFVPRGCLCCLNYLQLLILCGECT